MTATTICRGIAPEYSNCKENVAVVAVSPDNADALATMKTNRLYYGDILELLRNYNHFPDESVELCRIDPPFYEFSF